MPGQYHKFKLELLFYIKIINKKNDKEIRLELSALHNITQHNIWLPFLPLKTLPWLREQMAEMLAKHCGRSSEEIEVETPTQIPEKFLHMGMMLC